MKKNVPLKRFFDLYLSPVVLKIQAVFTCILFLLFNSCLQEDRRSTRLYDPSGEPVLIASSSAGVHRVDAFSLIRLKDSSLFGSFNYWTGGEGGDHGSCYQQLVWADRKGENLRWGKRFSYLVLGDITASHYQQENGNLVMLFLSQSYLPFGVLSVVNRVSTDGGKSYGPPVYLAGAKKNGERWIAAAGRIFKRRDGTLFFPVARRGHSNWMERDGFLFISKDDGESWSMAEKTAGEPLMITEPVAGYATEPGLYEAANDDLYYYYRSKTGYVRGCRLIQSGNYFSHDSLVNILPAPASTSEIKYIPAINQYMAVHNDAADMADGNTATGRDNMVYALSETGLPGSFVQMPNKISATKGKRVFEPFILPFAAPGGVVVTYTEFDRDSYKLYSRYISYEKLTRKNQWSGIQE